MADVASVDRADPSRMDNGGKVVGAIAGLVAGAWIGRAIFVWLLDVPGDWGIVFVVAVGLVGAILGVAAKTESKST